MKSITGNSAEWELRISDLWAAINDYSEEQFVARMEELAAELPADNAVALFALSRHMTRYQRSLANYAQLISDSPNC
jgi:hypothetical protein